METMKLLNKALTDLETQLTRDGYENKTYPTQQPHANVMGMMFDRYGKANKSAFYFDWQWEAKNFDSDIKEHELEVIQDLVAELTSTPKKRIIAIGKSGPAFEHDLETATEDNPVFVGEEKDYY